MRKRLRKFVFGGRRLVYYFTDWNLFIISSDKRFSIRLCHLFFPWEARPDGFTPLEIRGPEFPNYHRGKSERVWVKYPSVLHGDSTPGIVRQILEWCFDPEQKVELVRAEELRASFIEGDESPLINLDLPTSP